MPLKTHMDEQPTLNLTPMIDIVFNLLVFFMVITDLTQKDLVELTLPIAYMAQEDKDNDEDDRIILNVAFNYGGRVYLGTNDTNTSAFRFSSAGFPMVR